MHLKDIIFLVAAIIAWLYSSYRTYQKQNAKREKQVDDNNAPLPENTMIPLPRQKNVFRKEVPKRIFQEREKKVNKPFARPSPAISLETVTTDYTEDKAKFESKISDMKKKQTVDNVYGTDQIIPSTDYSVNEIIIEIQSGKTDWRKAIILNEILKPVHF